MNKEEKKAQEVKNVDLRQCVGTVIFCIIAACIAFIPYVISDQLIYAYQVLPSLSGGITFNEVYLGHQVAMISELFAIIPALAIPAIQTYLPIAMQYSSLIFFGILALDIVFCILLFITRSTILRFLFKIISILCGFIMLALFLCGLLYICGFLCCFINGSLLFEEILQHAKLYGVVYYLGFMVASAMLIKRQFKWFARLY